MNNQEDEGDPENGTERERMTFDAKPLIENWGQLSLGKVSADFSCPQPAQWVTLSLTPDYSLEKKYSLKKPDY